MNCSVTVVKCTDSAENTNSAVANNKAEDLEWVDRNWYMYRVKSLAHNWQRRKRQEKPNQYSCNVDVYYPANI
jgi:ribosome-binding ATPase YchF (GTP1/OBG family)